MKLFNQIKEARKEHSRKEREDKVQQDFQVSEHKGELWITFQGCCILPCSMLKKEPIEALKEIREHHI